MSQQPSLDFSDNEENLKREVSEAGSGDDDTCCGSREADRDFSCTLVSFTSCVTVPAHCVDAALCKVKGHLKLAGLNLWETNMSWKHQWFLQEAQRLSDQWHLLTERGKTWAINCGLLITLNQHDVLEGFWCCVVRQSVTFTNSELIILTTLFICSRFTLYSDFLLDTGSVQLLHSPFLSAVLCPAHVQSLLCNKRRTDIVKWITTSSLWENHQGKSGFSNSLPSLKLGFSFT